MLKSRAGNDQSVQTTTCAICGRSVVFTIVNSVVRAVVWGDLKSTSKYGSNSVAAGAEEAMSHVSSLLVDVGNSPLFNAAFGATFRRPLAKAEPATSSSAIITMRFFISSSLPSSEQLFRADLRPSIYGARVQAVGFAPAKESALKICRSRFDLASAAGRRRASRRDAGAPSS